MAVAYGGISSGSTLFEVYNFVVNLISNPLRCKIDYSSRVCASACGVIHQKMKGVKTVITQDSYINSLIMCSQPI